jgi:hypothetical protein
MAQHFRPAVNGIMFRSGYGLEVLGIVALKAAHERHAQAASEIWIFAVGLLPPTPARIAKDIDVWRPERQAEVSRSIVVSDGVVVLGARLSRNHVGNAMYKIVIPSRRQADGLREDSRVSRARDAMQPFVPPVVSRYTEPVDGGRYVEHLRNLLVERHAPDQVIHPLFDGKIWIEICSTLLLNGLAKNVGARQTEHNSECGQPLQQTKKPAHESSSARHWIDFFGAVN